MQYPLSVVLRPWMIAVTAGLLGGIVFVPLIVSVLYPLYVAAAFIVVVAVVGHCPVMAAALAVGCVLATRTPLRSDVPFVAVLLGLLPIGLYMYLFAFAGTNLATMKPMARLLFCVPFLAAFALTILGSAIVLALTEWTGRRPGVVWPVLAALLAIPVAIFYQKVGPDELRYSVIAQSLGPGDALFPEERLRAWKDRTGHVGLSPRTLANQVDGELDERRQRLIQRCEDFLRRYPKSKRAAEVLWVEAQAYSTQLVRRKLTDREPVIEYSAAWPQKDSAPCWQRLAEEYPQTPAAALARWRLAQLTAREGEFDKALRQLRPVVEALSATAANLAAQRGPFGEPRSTVPTVDYYSGAQFEAETLIFLIETNGAHLKDLEEYLDGNPCDTEGARRLAELRKKLVFPDDRAAAQTAPGTDSPVPPVGPGPASRP
jgi:hypothetical protein